MGFPDGPDRARRDAPGPDGWTAVIRSPEAVWTLVVWGRTPEAWSRATGGTRGLSTREETFDRSRPPPFDWHLPQPAFRSCVVVSRWDTLAPRGGGELIHERPWFYLGPERTLARRCEDLCPRIQCQHFALYRHDEEVGVGSATRGKEICCSSPPPRMVRRVRGHTRAAHRAAHAATPSHLKGPYNRWAIEAKLIEPGSGIDSRASLLRGAMRQQGGHAEAGPEADACCAGDPLSPRPSLNRSARGRARRRGGRPGRQHRPSAPGPLC